ncbi:15243_t:CDS:1 [Cetraspora pellucida]|uniref:15243_t:CDS:1 n=1 Tax=Cetraspora pellucida TaxID=1433469 RepID=A0ACA9P484_9GLOM|nr:15243_t:CDS:1 [Cetraspora pellucida]
MVTKYDELNYARFNYNSENKCMVLGDSFENRVALYLKKKDLNPKVIKNYLIHDRRLLFNDNNNKSMRSGNVIILKDGLVDGLEIYKIGKYTLFGDDGTDIMCNWNGYPLLVQCKYRSVCEKCKLKINHCTHGYWKRDMEKDVKKLDKKLSEYKIPIFGIFVISERIKIYNSINNINLENDMIVVNYSDELNEKINILGNQFLIKNQKMEWSIDLSLKERNELKSLYKYFEQTINDKINNITKIYYKNTKRILYYIRQAYHIDSLDDVCNDLENLKIV